MKKSFLIVSIALAIATGAIASPQGKLSDNEFERMANSSFEHADKKALEQYLSRPGNSQRLKQAFAVYSHIVSAEKTAVNWCAPYYKLTRYPVKLQKNFDIKKQKAVEILKVALGNNWQSVFSEMFAAVDKINQKQMEDDYNQTRLLAAQDGESMSKFDFCKMIDDNANSAADYKNQLFIRLFPNF